MKNNITKLLLFLFLVLCTHLLQAQTVLLEKELEKDTLPDVFGQNLKHFVHFMAGFGFTFGPSSYELPVTYGISNYYNLGLLYKIKATERQSFGADLHYRRYWYIITQDMRNTFPDSVLYAKERYTIQTINFNIFGRTNFEKKRGNSIGSFIDYGIGFDIPLGPKNKVRFTDPVNGNNVEISRANLGYVMPIYGTAFIRVGYKRYMAKISYRFTDIFNKSKVKEITQNRISEAFLPPIFVGIEIGIF